MKIGKNVFCLGQGRHGTRSALIGTAFVTPKLFRLRNGTATEWYGNGTVRQRYSAINQLGLYNYDMLCRLDWNFKKNQLKLKQGWKAHVVELCVPQQGGQPQKSYITFNIQIYFEDTVRL